MTTKEKHILIQGVLMDILGSGVLITGPSGIGKSELALGLIRLGHKLVADDCVEFYLNTDGGTLIGRCPALLQNLLEVRGLGIINVNTLFGKNAISTNASLDLIIQLIQINSSEFHSSNRLTSIQSQKNILDVLIPEISLPILANRNTALLVETAVRHFQSQSESKSKKDTESYSDTIL
jgi:HPr kinase/phosphorylase